MATATAISRAIVVQTLVHVHADSQVAGALRQRVGASAFVCVTTIRVVIAAELLDGNPILRDRERRSDHHHAARLDDLIVHVPTVETEHIIQALYNVDHLDRREPRL
jgi:hypothetical protein